MESCAGQHWLPSQQNTIQMIFLLQCVGGSKIVTGVYNSYSRVDNCG